MRLFGKTLLLAAAVIAAQLGSPARAELIGYWPFNESDGIEAADIAGGYTGELSDTAGWSTEAAPVQYGNGGSVDFGEFNNSAVVTMPTFTNGEDKDPEVGGFAAILASQEVTISFWQNRGAAPATNQVTFSFDDGGTRQLRSHAPWSNSNVYFDVAGCCGANQRINVVMGGTDTDEQWHHLAYVKKKNVDESEKAITAIFIDGTPVVTSPGCDATCWEDGAGDLVDWGSATIDDVTPIDLASIGAEPSGASSQDGLMDEFAIWNEALPTFRIQELAAGGQIIQEDQPDPGDFNDDKVIDVADWNILLENFNGPGTSATGDVNFDRKVNFKDFVAFREIFSAPAGAAAVPEPSSLTLLALAGLLSLGLRRRQAT